MSDDASTNRIIKQIPPTTKPFYEKNKKKVCAYVRVSTGQQEQLYSLENQKKYYERKLQQNPDYEYKGIFIDAGISGSKENRPAFQSMLAEARCGNLDIIITKSVSRFARNTIFLLKTIRELKALGVGVIFEEQNLNTLSSQGELMLTMLASIAEEERKSVCSNVAWSKRKAFEKGKVFINTNILLGYINDESGELQIDKQQAKIIRKIFKMYLEGMSAKAIARKLNDERVPTYLKNSTWNHYRVLRIISNEKYIGDCLSQKLFVKDGKLKRNRGELPQFYIHNHHKGIISRKDFDKAQQIRKSNMQLVYEYTGNLICPFCGDVLCHTKSNGKGDFICKTKLYKTSSACAGVRVPEEILAGYNLLPITEPLVAVEVDYVKGSKKRRKKKNFDFIPISQYNRK